MRKILIAAAAFAAVSILFLSATPALALNGKSWVANNGSDANDCSAPAAACRSFQRAYNQTAPGGEIGVVNAGDYGSLAVDHAINITNEGAGEAGFLFAGGCTGSVGVALDIAASPGDVISVRGLVFEGCISGGRGINFVSGGALHIQNCVFRDYEGSGGNAFAIAFVPDGRSQLSSRTPSSSIMEGRA